MRKRILLILFGAACLILFFVLALRVTLMEMSRGVESARAMGLSAGTDWDLRSMWGKGGLSVENGLVTPGESWIARSADLRTRSSSFDHSVGTLDQVVSLHHGYLEDLRTDNRSGFGRALSSIVSVPSDEFDAALTDLQKLGGTEAISQSGEDTAVRLATSARHLAAMQTNLARLQKLQHERKGELRDAVALEKDIAQAREAASEAERAHDELLTTVAQAHIRVTLVEDYCAPLQLSLAGASFQIRNSMVEHSFSAWYLSFGLPALFWLALRFWPFRVLYPKLRRRDVPLTATV